MKSPTAVGFDRDARHVRPLTKDVVSTLDFPARDQLAVYDYASLGEADFFLDMQDFVPPGTSQGLGDEFGADIAFGEAALAHAYQHAHRRRIEMANRFIKYDTVSDAVGTS